jgi:DNA polymerase-3 subunit epsilon
LLVAGFDLETEWTEPVDPRAARIWEAAIVVWDTVSNDPLVFHQSLTWQSDYKFDPRMKISQYALETFGGAPIKMLDQISKLFKMCDAVVAHNGKDFDKIVLEAEFKRHGFHDEPEMLWIDTTVDVPYPSKIETRKLEFLGPAHGFINPYSHRALFDVCSMLRVASHYDWNEIFRLAKTADIYVVADVPPPWKDQGAGTDAAKARGYRFDKDTKYWYKKIKEDQLELEKQQASFRVGVWKKKDKQNETLINLK